jgi:biotin operon repressor
MNSRSRMIIESLQTGPKMCDALARVCNCPDASIRRNIQELRKIGYRIAATSYQTGWEFRLY